MFEAYTTHQRLKQLEDQLPNDAAGVKTTLEKRLEKQPFENLALWILARCQLLCEELNEAKHTLETLISQDHHHVMAKVELAKILFNDDSVDSAVGLLRDAINMRPEIDGHWLLLSEYLQHDGQEQAARDALAQYDMIKAFNDNLGQAEQAFAHAEFIKADKLCRQLLEKVPNEVRTLRLLARLAKRFHHFEISTSILAQCIETQPDNAALGLEYAKSLLANKKLTEAFVQCQRLIGIAPENIDIYDLKAEVLYSLGRYEEAIAIYRNLSNVPEKRALSLLHLGKVLETVGDTKEAIGLFHQAAMEDPESGQVYWELANLRTYKFSDVEITAMRSLLKAGEISVINKVLIQFALGKALEDEKQFAESFQHYQAANSAYKRIQPIRYSNQNASLKSFFTAEFFSGLKETGNISAAPIFIVGLPRSGSTLVEQILTSHSMIDATGELTEIVSIARELNNPGQAAPGQYPQSLAALSENKIQGLAQRYLEYAQEFRQQAPYFVDKAPGNFHHIGLIKTLFPRAKIIDIRRNPMASGWSLYRHFFADSFRFSYDLEIIGKYYNDYIDLMDYWHEVLPGQILTIRYEELITDLPAAVNGLLQYCGLEFEQSCLDFHLNKRAVATPSSEQVRQPLYTDALDHWKNYDQYLTPLKNAIGKK